ncbi:hypothetical protein ACH4UM_19125 [Streptomyces sp. NPDC020801]
MRDPERALRRLDRTAVTGLAARTDELRERPQYEGLFVEPGCPPAEETEA